MGGGSQEGSTQRWRDGEQKGEEGPPPERDWGGNTEREVMITGQQEAELITGTKGIRKLEKSLECPGRRPAGPAKIAQGAEEHSDAPRACRPREGRQDAQLGKCWAGEEVMEAGGKEENSPAQPRDIILTAERSEGGLGPRNFPLPS